MDIVKKIIKTQKEKVFLRKLPFSGKINFFITVFGNISGIYSFFCASNIDFEPSFHISLENSGYGINLLLGRYDVERLYWYHIKSNIRIEIGVEYSIEIFYGKNKNAIYVGNVYDDKFIESKDVAFGNTPNYQLTFGDPNKLPDVAPIKIKNFQVRDIYGSQENTNIFNVPEPKILDLKSCRVFS